MARTSIVKWMGSLILIGLVVGCASKKPASEPAVTTAPPHAELSKAEKSIPVEGKKEYPRDFEAVWAAAIGVLHEHGDPIIYNDKANGIITTDFKSEEDTWRHKFNLLLVRKGETSTSVSVTCIVEKMIKSAFIRYGNWEDKKSDGKRESQLLSDIGQRLQLQSQVTK